MNAKTNCTKRYLKHSTVTLADFLHIVFCVLISLRLAVFCELVMANGVELDATDRYLS